ncbi:MAG: hypothetical protein H0T69_19870 [Thermoleophilaceae bacterium]|nr:hypothetical protein [Thermoleophilaceae bacterium]
MLRRLPIAACVLALAAPLGLAACGDEEPGIDEPAREGLAIELGGVDYTVFITRELNPDITPDDAYVTTEAPAGQALYGVFLKACNVSDDERSTAADFTVHDNQENTFEPEPLPEDNQFAYTARTLDPKECIPEAGSVAQLGPTAASMLLFQFPLENTENRPLELEIEQDGQKRTFELDI